MTTQGKGNVSLSSNAGRIVMNDGTHVTTLGGLVTMTALGDILIASIDAGSGDIRISAGGTITDNSQGETANLTTTGTASLTAGTGIGLSGTGDIDTATAVLEAGNSSGDIWIQAKNGLTIGSAGVRTLGENGNVNVDVAAGDLRVRGSVSANGTGQVNLSVLVGNLTLDAGRTIGSAGGEIVLGAESIAQNGYVETSNSASITATANSGDIVMGEDSRTTTIAGEIHYSAKNSIALGRLVSASGNIFVKAETGSITDNTTAEASNLTTTGTATLSAGAGIGASGVGGVDTTIVMLQATAGGSIWVRETNGLTLTGMGMRVVEGTNGFGTLSMHRTASLNASTANITLSVDAGSLAMASGTVIATLGGDVTVTVAVDILLSAIDAHGGKIQVTAGGSIIDNTPDENANLVSAGAVALTAGAGIGATGAADIDTTTGALTALAFNGDIWLQGTNGVVIGSSGVKVLGGTGVIAVDTVSGDLRVGGVISGQGNVTLSANSGNLIQDAGMTISSIGGDIVLTANGVTQNGILSTGIVGAVTVSANNGNLVMGNASRTQTAAGAIVYSATESISLGRLIGASGNITISAARGAITDNTSVETANLVTTGAVMIKAGTSIGALGTGISILQSALLPRTQAAAMYGCRKTQDL